MAELAEVYRNTFVTQCSHETNYIRNFYVTTRDKNVIIFGTSDDFQKWKPKGYQHLTNADYFKLIASGTTMDIYPSLDNYKAYTMTQHKKNPEDGLVLIAEMRNTCVLVSQLFSINHRIWDILVDMRTRFSSPDVVRELTKFSDSVPAKMWAMLGISAFIHDFGRAMKYMKTLSEVNKGRFAAKAMEFVELLEDFHDKNYEGPPTWVDPYITNEVPNFMNTVTLSSFIDKCFV